MMQPKPQYDRTLASLRAGMLSAAMIVLGCFAAAIFFSGSQLEAQASEPVSEANPGPLSE